MKNFLNTQKFNNQVINDDNFQEIILEIILDVTEKRKLIHSTYSSLIKKVWCSSKSKRTKTMLGKYLLGRLIRESDRAFNKGQLLAKQLCPDCKKDFANYDSYSEKLH